MNCQRIAGVISDLARDQMVEASTRDEVLEHCEACASCACTLSDQHALTVALRSLAKRLQSMDAPHLIQQNLTAALSAQTTKLKASGNSHRRQYWAGVVAAMLLIFLAVGGVYWQKQSAKTSPSASMLVEASSTEAPAPSAEFGKPDDPQNPKPGKPNIPNRRANRFAGRESIRQIQSTSAKATATYGSSEIATEFLPLGYGSALSLQDGGQIVRVEVPRSTLVSFGLPVNMDRLGQRVKADLLLGVDGSARAIRFVQ